MTEKCLHKKSEIAKMAIPIIGIWWIIKRILPKLVDISWYNIDDNAILIILVLTYYQIMCWIGLKVLCIWLVK